jgi:hypothetical protein
MYVHIHLWWVRKTERSSNSLSKSKIQALYWILHIIPQPNDIRQFWQMTFTKEKRFEPANQGGERQRFLS